MQAHRLETILTQNGTLVLHSLPFQAGELVEVIILAKTPISPAHNRYPLRGLPVTYINPAEPVAQADWEIMR